MKNNAPALYCYVKNVSEPDAAIFCARQLVHPRDWKSEFCNVPDELAAFRAMREERGQFTAAQRRGHFIVSFTPEKKA